MPQTAIYKFVNLKAENHWEQVGSLNLGKYRHGVVPLDSHPTTSLFVVSGYAQGKKTGDKANEKSNSVELIIL